MFIVIILVVIVAMAVYKTDGQFGTSMLSKINGIPE